jgi:hypothetical protein
MTEHTSRFRNLLRSGSVLVGGLLVAVGLLGVIGLGVAAAWSDQGHGVAAEWQPVAEQATARQATDQTDDLTQRMRDMLRDRLNLSDEEAQAQAEEMAQHMREVHGDDAQAMLDECQGYWNDGTTPGGGAQGNDQRGRMMDGYGDGYGPGSMMDGYGDGYGPGRMMDGNGGGYGGMGSF